MDQELVDMTALVIYFTVASVVLRGTFLLTINQLALTENSPVFAAESYTGYYPDEVDATP
jgi:hypothetical protein